MCPKEGESQGPLSILPKRVARSLTWITSLFWRERSHLVAYMLLNSNSNICGCRLIAHAQKGQTRANNVSNVTKLTEQMNCLHINSDS